MIQGDAKVMIGGQIEVYVEVWLLFWDLQEGDRQKKSGPDCDIYSKKSLRNTYSLFNCKIDRKVITLSFVCIKSKTAARRQLA